jgi:hypothetical protein
MENSRHVAAALTLDWNLPGTSCGRFQVLAARNLGTVRVRIDRLVATAGAAPGRAFAPEPV